MPQGEWLDYVRGAIGCLVEDGARATGLDVTIASTVPLGAGLSSSAALGVALLRGLCELWNHPLGDTDLPRLAQRSEQRW